MTECTAQPVNAELIAHGARFNDLLHAYLGDAGQAAQFVYAYLAIHAVAGSNDDVDGGSIMKHSFGIRSWAASKRHCS